MTESFKTKLFKFNSAQSKKHIKVHMSITYIYIFVSSPTVLKCNTFKDQILAKSINVMN